MDIGACGKDKNKDTVECWNCGKRGHPSKDCRSKNDNKGKGKHKKVATDAHNLDSKKPEEGNNEPEVEIGGFHMCSLLQLTKCESLNGSRLELTQVQERRRGPRMSHAGRRSLSDLVFRTATGELAKSNKQLYVDGSDDWVTPRGNKTDVMPLSSSGVYQPGPNLQDRKTKKTQEEQEEQEEEHMTQCKMTQWMVKSSWCRGCRIYLLNPAQDRSLNTCRRDMQCTEAGVAIALRRRVERTHTLPERKESCQKLASTVASLVVIEKMCCRSCV